MTFNPQFAQIDEILIHDGVVTEEQVKERKIFYLYP